MPLVPAFQLVDAVTDLLRGSSIRARSFCCVASIQPSGMTQGSPVPSTSRWAAGRSSGARWSGSSSIAGKCVRPSSDTCQRGKFAAYFPIWKVCQPPRTTPPPISLPPRRPASGSPAPSGCRRGSSPRSVWRSPSRSGERPTGSPTAPPVHAGSSRSLGGALVFVGVALLLAGAVPPAQPRPHRRALHQGPDGQLGPGVARRGGRAGGGGVGGRWRASGGWPRSPRSPAARRTP